MRVLSILLTLLLLAPPAMALNNEYALFAIPADPGSDRIDPIALIDLKGEPLRPPAASASRWKPHVRSGRDYPMYCSGTRTGSAKIVDFMEGKRFSGHVQTTVPRTVNAVATDIKPRKHYPQRNAKTWEKRALTELATDELKKNGAGSLNELKTVFNARDFDGDGVHEVIGDFFLPYSETNPQPMALLMVARSRKGKLKPDMVVLRKITDKELFGGTPLSAVDQGLASYTFYDNFDIDRDGTDEIIARMTAWEGVWYSIWKRKLGGWSKIFETYSFLEKRR